MTLYEATNGMEGAAYVRCYVWANDDVEAGILARQAFKTALCPLPGALRRLLTDTDAPFATAVSDEGWVENSEVSG